MPNREDAVSTWKGELKQVMVTSLIDDSLKNFLPGTPLSRTEEVPVERTDLIHPIHLASKPVCFMTLMIVSCSIILNASPKSSLNFPLGLMASVKKQTSCLISIILKVYIYVSTVVNVIILSHLRTLL